MLKQVISHKIYLEKYGESSECYRSHMLTATMSANSAGHLRPGPTVVSIFPFPPQASEFKTMEGSDASPLKLVLQMHPCDVRQCFCKAL